MLRGILLGAILTIVGVYVSDSITVHASTPGFQQRTMVNWDVVGANLQRLAGRLQDEWTKRTG